MKATYSPPARSGTPLDDHRGDGDRCLMSAWSAHRVGRRWFLTQTGRGAVGIAVLGLVACSDDGGRPAGQTTSRSDEESPRPTPSESAETGGELAWSRVDLGFVSAYVLVRGREAAVVDTGVGGSLE